MSIILLQLIVQPTESPWLIGTIIIGGLNFLFNFFFKREFAVRDKKDAQIDKHLESTDHEIEEIKKDNAKDKLEITVYLKDMEMRLMKAISETKK